MKAHERPSCLVTLTVVILSHNGVLAVYVTGSGRGQCLVLFNIHWIVLI